MSKIARKIVYILFLIYIGTTNCVAGDKNKLPFLAYLDLVGNSNSFFVSERTPGSGVSNIPLNTSIQATFSSEFDSSSVTSSTFILHKDGIPIQTNLSFNGSNAVLTPNADLSASTAYTVEIKKDIKSTQGKSLKEDLSWNFTTSTIVDAVPPTLSLRTPSIGASLVPDNTSIQIAFSETVDCTTVDNSTFILKNDTTLILEPSTVNCTGTNATLIPDNPLLPNTTYRVNVNSFIQDLAQNPLTTQTWTFTTGAGPDGTPPILSFASPGPGVTGIAINAGISVAFSETIQCGTIAGNFTLDDNPLLPGLIAVNVSCSGTTASITPVAPLAYNTTYTVNVSNGITDLSNNPTTNTTWTFTTGTAPDSTAPSVTFTFPINNTNSVGTNTIPTAVFSEPMACASVNTASFKVRKQSDPPGVYLLGSVNCFGTSATWTPNVINPFAYNTAYTAEISTGALDTEGNPIVFTSWNFTTGAGPDVTAPTISFVTAMNGSVGVSINTGINIAFDETMSCGSILALGSITLDDDPMTPATTIPINIACNGNTVAVTPTAPLAYNTTYTAKIAGTVTDAVGNPIVPFTWSFTTGAASDSTPPQVSLVSPSAAATNVATNSNITVAFNETIDCSTLNFTINNGITGTVNCSGASATFVPNVATPLNAGTTYTASIGAVNDLANNSMLALPFTWNFTTGLAPDVTAPTVAIQNLRNNSITESGFVIGTSSDDRSVALVEISIDGSTAYAPVIGTTNWKYQLPIGGTTWKSNSQHTIQVRSRDTSNNVTTSPLITVRKGTNKDINGDGYSDLVAPEYGQGLVFIFHSSGNAGITTTAAQFASKIIVGTATTFFGKTVAMGDLNGDGYADVVVGAPKYQSAGTNNGRVYIFYSSGTAGITSTLAAFANSTLTGTSGTNDRFGDALATGDINGDGYSDVIVGAPSYNVSTGRMYVFHSAGATGIATVGVNGAGAGASSFKSGGVASERFGFSLATGNINGGNEDDIAVGAPGYNNGTGVDWGRICIYYGSGAGLTAAINTLINNTGNVGAGPGGPAQYGYTVAVADVTGDGFADVIGGAPFFVQVGGANVKKQGRVTMFSSAGAGGVANGNIGAAIRVYTGINSIDGQNLGITLGVRDMDLDGRADVIIVSAAAGPNTVYVYLNSAASAAIRDTTVADVTMVTGALYGIVGVILNGPGIPLAISDVNGDGLPDILINDSEAVRIYHSAGGATPITNNPAGANNVIIGTGLGNGIGGSSSNSNEFGSALY